MYTADELEIRCALAGSPRAEQLIACLEGEVAKRDARIEAQESQIKILQSDANSWQSGYDEGRRMGAKHAAPVSEAKAQCVVMPDRDAVIRKAVGMCNRIPGSTTWNAAEFAYDELADRLNAAPAAPSQGEQVRVVPVEPTEAMRKAAQDKLASEGLIVTDWLIHTAYSAMLSAATAAPAADAGHVFYGMDGNHP